MENQTKSRKSPALKWFKPATFLRYPAQYMIFFCILTIFLPYYVTSVAVSAVGLLFCLLPCTRNKIFSQRSSFLMLGFCMLTGVVALSCQNYIGLMRTGVFAAMMVVAVVARAVNTAHLFERMMDLLCFCGSISAIGAVVERIYHRNIAFYRCKALFVNPNFYGAAAMLVALICIYKLLSGVGKPLFYFICLAFNGIGIYLCGSMSLWVILFFGITVMLLLNHEYRLLVTFLAALFVLLVSVILFPHIIPRLNELSTTTANRVLIWEFAIEQIKKAPFLGHGFFSYRYLYYANIGQFPEIYKASLAHNILLDSILCHGIIGTVILGTYGVIYARQLLDCRDALCRVGASYQVFTFITAAAACIAVYGMIDTTMIWVQTGLILLLIFSGIGVHERQIRHWLRKGEQY